MRVTRSNSQRASKCRQRSDSCRALSTKEEHDNLPKYDFTILLPPELRYEILKHVVPMRIVCGLKSDDCAHLAFNGHPAYITGDGSLFTEHSFMVSRRYRKDMLGVCRLKAVVQFSQSTLGYRVGWKRANALNGILDGQLLRNVRIAELEIQTCAGEKLNGRGLLMAKKITDLSKFVQLFAGTMGTACSAEAPNLFKLRTIDETIGYDYVEAPMAYFSRLSYGIAVGAREVQITILLAHEHVRNLLPNKLSEVAAKDVDMGRAAVTRLVRNATQRLMAELSKEEGMERMLG